MQLREAFVKYYFLIFLGVLSRASKNVRSARTVC